ncbi:MAG: GYF domain-containing protein [Phycisphaeraceae bacterium]
MTETGQQVFVRFRGRVSGPFTAEQVKQMIKRGQLTRVHHVSTDRHNWKRADTVLRQFQRPSPVISDESTGHAKATAGEAASAVGEEESEKGNGTTSSAAHAKRAWFYSLGDSEVGPIAEERLRQLLQGEGLDADTLFWREGMATWRPLEQTDLYDAGPSLETASLASRRVRPTSRSGKVGSKGNYVGLSLGSMLLLLLHIPVVLEDNTVIWWWNMTPNLWAGIVLGMLCAIGTGLCLVAPLTSGLARAVTFVVLGAVGIVLLVTLTWDGAAIHEVGLAWLILGLSFGLSGVSRARALSLGTVGLRNTQGILGGILTGVAIIFTALWIFSVSEAGGFGPMQGGMVLGATLVGSGYLSLVAAGIGAICNLRLPCPPQLNRAVVILSLTGPIAIFTGVGIIVAVVLQVAVEWAALPDVPASADVQMQLMIFRMFAIVILVLLIFEWGLYELLAGRPKAGRRSRVVDAT